VCLSLKKDENNSTKGQNSAFYLLKNLIKPIETMETKLQIIETPDYILAVSDEEIKEGDYRATPHNIEGHILSDRIIISQCDKNFIINHYINNGFHKKITAYQPKGSAPELDLPLLPEIVVEDDVKKLALINEIYPEYPTEYNAFIKGHKSATKVYSEDDLREAIKQTRYGMLYNKQYEDEFIQSLKQPKTPCFPSHCFRECSDKCLYPNKTPKWFVAEIEEWLDQTYSEHGCYRQRLKTTTINGKTYLIGNYE